MMHLLCALRPSCIFRREAATPVGQYKNGRIFLTLLAYSSHFSPYFSFKNCSSRFALVSINNSSDKKRKNFALLEEVRESLGMHTYTQSAYEYTNIDVIIKSRQHYENIIHL